MAVLSRPSLATSLLLALALAAAPGFAAQKHEAHDKKPTAAQQKKSKATHTKKSKAKKSKARSAAADKAHADKSAGTDKSHADKTASAGKSHGPLADLRNVRASKDVVHLANWVSYTYDSGRRPFVIIDKKAAKMFVFDGWGKLWSTSPVLIGKAVGDDSAPGVGSKRLSQLKAHEKTTPAGRFEARPGKDNHGKDVVWIDFDAALSMHAIASVSASERRAERMATKDPGDNRISNGCINLPPKFFSGVLLPTVRKSGAVVYVLPETRTVAQQFGAHDVTGGGKSTA
jgi:hypothetical protein